MTQLELDPQFVHGLRLLHSSNKDSMDQLRILLDETIKQKHGLTKMLSNVLHKKYTMEEPVLSDHSSCSSKKSKSSSSSSRHSKLHKSDSLEELPMRETPPDILQSDDPLAEILEDDLTCVVCKGMDVGAQNRLVECANCHSLYHQECHSPAIQDSQIDVPKSVWYCANCIKTNQSVKDKASPKSESKKDTKKSSKHKSSSQADSSKVTPTIHIIGGDRRIKEMSKKSKTDKRTSSSGSGKTSSNSSSSSPASGTKNSGEKSLYKSKTLD